MQYSRPSILILLVFIFFTACQETEPVPSDDSIVTINGNDYPTVKIGIQTWTALNYQGQGGVAFSGTIAKPEYGKYYTLEELKAIPLPAGWRIPTMQDYNTMADAIGIVIPDHKTYTDKIKTLTSATNWKNVPGTNASGFNAHPAGYIFGASIPMDGDIAEFWTAEGNTLSIQENGNLDGLRILFYASNTSPDYRFNARFVKD